MSPLLLLLLLFKWSLFSYLIFASRATSSALDGCGYQSARPCDLCPGKRPRLYIVHYQNTWFITPTSICTSVLVHLLCMTLPHYSNSLPSRFLLLCLIIVRNEFRYIIYYPYFPVLSALSLVSYIIIVLYINKLNPSK